MASTYQQIAPVIFGTEALTVMAGKIADEGKKNVFVVTDKGVTTSGITDKISQVLEDRGLRVSIFDECIPDAPDTFVDQVADVARKMEADCIIGLGGGSSMDTAKAAGVAMDNNRPIATFMEENGNPGFDVKTPVYVVPTSAGTGSECTPMCVIHEMSSDTKKVVLRAADQAVLDPELTVSCPKGVTVNSGLDALSHAVEAVTSVNPNPKDKLLALHSIKLIGANLYECVNHPDNIEARSNMLFAANIAGIAFAEMSVHIGHCFAHEAGLRFRLNHGLACGLSIPETIEFVAEKKPVEVLEIGKALGLELPPDIEPKKAGHLVADRVRMLMRECGLKSLKELGIAREDAISIARGAIENNWFHVMCPGDVTEEQMAKYIADIYDNYQ